MKSVRQVALSDISKYAETVRKERNDSLMDYERTIEFNNSFDSWVVTKHHLSGKEISKLNRLLDIHKINKFGNTNGIRTK